MALNGRVNQNCSNVSNPYHQCTQACMQKSKQTKPHTHRKTSSFGRNVTDGELGKKINEVRRTYSGCAKASNPYHHCDENCNKRLSNSGVTPPSTLDRKKKLSSKPEPPVLDSVPASKVGEIYLSGASSPISHYRENKKVDPKSIEQIPSKHISEQVHIQDVMPVYHKDQLKDGTEQLVNPIQTNEEDKIASHEVVPIINVDDTVQGITASPGGSIHFSFSVIPHDNEDSDDEGEAKAVISETRIPVGSYHVKESFGPILQSILDKYGDIGATCHLESLVIRSYYIECVCFVVQELQSSSIIELSNSKVKELLAILKDVESAQLRVAWLRSILDEIAENIELIDQHRDVKVTKANSDSEMESLREELESQVVALAQKEKEVADVKARIPEIRDRLSQLELKSCELDQSMLSIKSKVDNMHSKSLIEELL